MEHVPSRITKRQRRHFANGSVVAKHFEEGSTLGTSVARYEAGAGYDCDRNDLPQAAHPFNIFM